jgi:RNA polymerase sigma factor for flagellar operon FliA
MQRPCVPVTEAQHDRVVATLPFVQALARRVAASMPHSIDLGDLTQDGMIGLIDAAHRFDESRGIKFETFAERRVRGAMIDALRRDAWPRGVRRMRRQLETAREDLRRELGCEPSLADLAARVGADEARLGRTILRISTIEATSPLASVDGADEGTLPAVLAPPEIPAPDRVCEEAEVRERVQAAVAALPPRERRVIELYYFGDVTMKQIGAAIGVNESRVSQLHARAVERLRARLAATDGTPAAPTTVIQMACAKKRMAYAHLPEAGQRGAAASGRDRAGVVVRYPSVSRASRSSSASRNGFGSHRQPLSSRNRSASVPATSPVTKMTRRASAGDLVASAR